MVMVGFAAPRFDCKALVEGKLRRLRWQQVHENQTLLLLFNAHTHAGAEPAELRPFHHAAGRLQTLGAKVAVVCRAPLADLMAWEDENRPSRRRDEPLLPLILDADDYLTWLYDLVLADGTTLWGQFLIDPGGVVRHKAVSSFPVVADEEELIRAVKDVAPSKRCR